MAAETKKNTLQAELIQAAEKNHFNRLQTLETFPPGENISGIDAETKAILLLCFADHGNIEAIHFLMAKGANPTIRSEDYPYWLPYETAQESGHTDAKKWLIFYTAQYERLIEIETLDIFPGVDTFKRLTNKLITTLLYEDLRENQANVKKLQNYLSLIDPKYAKYFIKDFNREISDQETIQETFFGSYLSDTSDSEEEKEFKRKPLATTMAKLAAAESLSKKANRENMRYQRKTGRAAAGDLKITGEPATFFNLSERPQITRGGNLVQINADLAKLNACVKDSKELSLGTISELKLKTKFFILQSRGITHLTSRWSKPQRMRHRKMEEKGLPIFSQAAYKRANLALDALHDHTTRPQYILQLTTAATEIAQVLLTLRDSGRFEYKKQWFDCLGDLLQQLYTTDYDAFHRLLKEDKTLKDLFPEGANPFVSTGGRPYHALKYAYGIKPYAGHENERLRPRWRKNGRAERPYSGKVYLSLHPILDYGVGGPAHVPSLNTAGRIVVNADIIAEYETTFPAWIAANRTIHTHIAKYPSFRDGYKTIFLYKYGLTPALYEKFREAFQEHPPHTPGNKSIKRLLGEWLCAYHELCLIHLAQKEAEARGGVLIYRTLTGEFSLDLGPATLLHSSTEEEQRAPIMAERAKRKLADNVPAPRPVAAADFEEKIAKLTAELKAKPNSAHLPKAEAPSTEKEMTQREFEALYKGGRKNFSGVQFAAKIDFTEWDLSDMDFTNATLQRARFDDTNKLSEVDFSGADLADTSFTGCDLTKVNFTNVNAPNVNFSGSNLSGIDFSESTLHGAIFDSLANEETRLDDVNFSGADLEGASFNGAGRRAITFNDTQFVRAQLRGAKFTSCDLSATDFDTADLTESSFQYCHLYGYEDRSGHFYQATSFNGATVTDATFENVEWKPKDQDDAEGEESDQQKIATFNTVKGQIASWTGDQPLPEELVLKVAVAAGAVTPPAPAKAPGSLSGTFLSTPPAKSMPKRENAKAREPVLTINS
jgi:uncharacterized protein YjbI with pentapeptide repeats